MNAALGSVAFFVLAPGVTAGLLPWWLTGWQMRDLTPAWLPVRALGALLIFAGIAVLIDGFVRFVMDGVGTPAPAGPTERLVVSGPYRRVRNPMYLAVSAIIVGQALTLGQIVLVPYALAFSLVTYLFVRWYEEPYLQRRFGAQYDAYRRHVRAWWPMPKSDGDAKP
jgi:protein-S-isoprenylcysteine O-methyltransferase Ste14